MHARSLCLSLRRKTVKEDVMTVVSSKEFRARQSHYLRMVRSGEHVVLRSRGGRYRVTFEPTTEDSEEEQTDESARDVTAEICQAMKDWRDYLNGDETKMLSWEEFLDAVQN